ncbi:MAG TPA: DUF2946 family protein [Ramlibacter sp.]|uniref:DUF2946 family protein n=1 Tax=Ramlibacter sp. TaxID=1917967 RepID=UPI002D8001F2|nr:DUF2946 family protein [Ramlibacter sp.]HET8744400.1 DUF2946 family protein [Ramlibacter sp.]
MESLRRVHRLTCQLLLVWFALWVGAAAASPMLAHHDADVVCSGSGIVLPTPQGDGSGAAQDHEHDCRLCVMVGAPPVPLVFAAHEAPDDTPILQLPTPVPSQAPVPFQQRGPPQL